MSSIRVSLFIIFLPLLSFSQDLTLENNRSSLKWNQINTGDFRIIYPSGFDSEAQRMANTLQHLHEAEAQTMGGDPPKKISIVLQTKNAISNGFVTLGPRRSEFQTMPPQDYSFLSTNRWLDMLAVHEFRHVVQYQHSKTGWNKFFYYLFGENTQAGMAFAAAPPWFYEGDAVVIESALTPAGRGRLPSFNLVFKANLLEGKRFNYHKQHLRSYKDFIPNHYVLGYNLVGHLRRRTHDPKIMAKVTRRAFGWPFIPFTFSNALKKETGKYLVPNYELMMNELDSLWRGQLEGLELSDFERVNKRDFNGFTDYQYPQSLDDGRLIVLKSGIGDIQQFVSIDGAGHEHLEFIPGMYNDAGMLSTSGQKLVWNEYTFDPRWRAHTYSVIKGYDFRTGKEKTITHKSRYSAAALSPQGDKLITVLNTEENENFVVIIDYENGGELKRFNNPDNSFYAMPSWSADGGRIVALKITDHGKSVVLIDNATGKETVLIPESRENIGSPVLYDNFLLYNSPYSGIDNIYAKNIDTGEVYQVTSSKYGAYNPSLSPDKQWLYYNDHTVNGLDVVKIAFDPSRWKPLAEVEDRNVAFNQSLVEQEGKVDILESVPNEKYPVRHYSKLGHAINIHSWGPYANTDLTQAQLGVFSRDVLSTTNISLGYNYDLTEEVGFGSLAVSYQGFYPIIDFELTKGKRSTTESVRDSETNQVKDIDFNWDETSVNLGLRLPLLLTKSKYVSQLSLSNNVELTKVENFNQGSRLFLDQQANGTLYTNQASVSYYRLLKQSTRDIYSKWGQTFGLSQTSSLFGGDYDAGQTAIRATLYFPGLFKHHSFYVRGGFQHKNWKLDTVQNDTYLLRNQLPLPRGYSHSTWEDFYAVAVNYALPLWYPDIALGPVLNLNRIRVNFFYDYGYSKIDLVNKSQNIRSRAEAEYNSFGADVLFDMHILRFPPELSIGFRISYAQSNDYSTGGSRFEVLLANVAF